MQNGQTPLNIAQKLGYISVIETLKVVTEITTITTTTTTTVEEKYRVVAPEGMHETFMSDSEEEGGKYPFAYTPSPFCTTRTASLHRCSIKLLMTISLLAHQRRIYWRVMVVRPTNNMSIYRISTVPPCSPVSYPEYHTIRSVSILADTALLYCHIKTGRKDENYKFCWFF